MLPIPPVDLAAEKAASRARRDAAAAGAHRRSRAMMVLSGQWSAGRGELKAVIEERYPAMDPKELEMLLDLAMELQRTERRHVDAAELAIARPRDPDLLEEVPSLEPETEETLMSQTQTARPYDRDRDREAVLVEVRRFITKNPRAKPKAVRAHVAEVLKIEIPSKPANITSNLMVSARAARQRAAAAKAAEVETATAAEPEIGPATEASSTARADPEWTERKLMLEDGSKEFPAAPFALRMNQDGSCYLSVNVRLVSITAGARVVQVLAAELDQQLAGAHA